jgi:AraC-like DNA-binding protein
MAIDFCFSNGRPLKFVAGMPEAYAGPVLGGSVAAWAESDMAQVLVQELDGGEYSIRYNVVRMFKGGGLIGLLRSAGLYSYFMLQNALRKEVEGLGKFHLRQDQYFSFFTQPSSFKLRLDRGREYRTLDIFYSPRLLEEMYPYFPELMELVTLRPGRALLPKSCWTLPGMGEITQQLLNCPYDEHTRQFYFDLKVRELLYHVLEYAYRRKITERQYTPWEVKKIHDARDILEGHVRGKPPRLRELSRQVGLNEYKLKAGFRQYFNAGIFEWLWERKMQYARHVILHTNTPIKEVGMMVGYPLITNFITAFRRRFGLPPGALRRK